MKYIAILLWLICNLGISQPLTYQDPLIYYNVTTTKIGLIPKMTGTNTPSGVVTFSAENSANGNFAWQVFDRNGGIGNDYWDSSAILFVQDHFVGYQFASLITTTQFEGYIANSTGVDIVFSFQYSTNNITWNTLYSTNLPSQGLQYVGSAFTPTTANYFRWYISYPGNLYSVSGYGFQLY